MSANRKYRERISRAVCAMAGVGYRRGPRASRLRPRSRSSAARITSTAPSSSGVRPAPHGCVHRDRVLAVNTGGEEALVSRAVVRQEPGLGQDFAESPQLARVLVHLPRDLALPGVELLLQCADLGVTLKQLAK